MINFEDLKKANDQIKSTNISGKDYAEVNQRIKAFRMVYPLGTIETEIVSIENGICIFHAVVKATVELPGGRVGEVLLGTGTAYEKENSSFINKTSYIENCETSAVGRALGMAGFGIDCSVASAEEVQNARLNQEAAKDPAPADDGPKPATPYQKATLRRKMSAEKREWAEKTFGANFEKLSWEGADKLMKKLDAAAQEGDQE